MDDPLQTVVMDPRGDVVLRVGRNDTPPRTFLVNSHVLSLASPVFAAMFDGRFAEGHGLSATTPPEVPLPDDDPAATEKLLNIVHMHIDRLDERIDHIDLANFAIVCNKYDCVDIVRMHSRSWVAELSKDYNHTQFAKLVFTTYLLDLPLEFYQATRTLLLNIRMIQVTKIVHDPLLLPLIVIDKLIAAKLELLDSICYGAVFHQTIYDAINNGCGFGQEAVYQIFPMYTRICDSISRSIPDMKNCTSAMRKFPETGCTMADCECNKLYSLKEDILGELDAISNCTKGLCLDCVQCEAATGQESNNCRVPHN